MCPIFGTLAESDMSAKKFLTVQEIEQLFEDSEFFLDLDNVDVAIIPSDPDILTDAEDIEENDLEYEEVRDVAGTLELFTDPAEQSQSKRTRIF